MDCAKTRFFLNAYLDGELPEPDRREVSDHLARCPRCGHRLESFRRVRAILKDSSHRASAPVDLRRRIAERRVPVKGWRRNLWPVITAAALSLLVLPVVADSLIPPKPSAAEAVFGGTPVERVVHGHFFCLRCELSQKFGLAPPNRRSAQSPYLAAFRSDSGTVWILLNRDACPRTLPKCAVSVTGHFFDAGHLLDAENIQLASASH